MDLACSVRQPNVLCGSEGTSYKRLGRFDSRIMFRSGDFSCKFLGNSRIPLKASLSKKMKKAICSSLGAGEKSDGLLRSLNSRITLFYNFDNVLKGPRAVRSQCQGNDSLAYVNGNSRNVEFLESNGESSGVRPPDSEISDSREEEGKREREDETDVPTLDELRELLQKAMRELEVAQINSTMFEEKAQRISEAAIALKDEATNAWNDVNSTLDTIQQIVNEESVAKEAVRKATMALSLAEARVQVALEVAKGQIEPSDSAEESDGERDVKGEETALSNAQEDIRECQLNLANCEEDLRRLKSKKVELQKEVDRLNVVAEKVQLDALKAEEDVANIMLLAEQAVAFELEATQHVNDAEIALQRAEKSLSNSPVDTTETTQVQMLSDTATIEEERIIQGTSGDTTVELDRDVTVDGDSLVPKPLPDILSEQTKQISEDLNQVDDLSDNENVKLSLDSLKESEIEAEKRNVVQTKKQDSQRDFTRESSPFNAPKSLLKKSSRFFPASFFSFTVDGTEFTPASVFQGVRESLRKQWPKLVVGLLLFGAG